MALRAEIGTLAVELASRVVGESLESEARQRRTVDRFLEQLEEQSGSAAEAEAHPMRGASRASLAEAKQRLGEVLDGDVEPPVSWATSCSRSTGLLDAQAGLRRALSDPSPGRPRAGQPGGGIARREGRRRRRWTW